MSDRFQRTGMTIMDEKKRIVEEGYDRIAEAYTEARREMSPIDGKYLRLLMDLIPKGSKILDMGCGSGLPITKFLAQHHDVTGVDISEKQVELARRQVPEATFIKADMADISFPDETFRAICSFTAIIHVPREEHADLFKQFYRMLEMGGLLLVTLGSTDWVSSEDDSWFGVKMFWSHYGPETTIDMLEDAGFRVIQSSIEGEEFQGKYEESLYVLAEKGPSDKP